jgi:hypothetical protein
MIAPMHFVWRGCVVGLGMALSVGMALCAVATPRALEAKREHHASAEPKVIGRVHDRWRIHDLHHETAFDCMDVGGDCLAWEVAGDL